MSNSSSNSLDESQFSNNSCESSKTLIERNDDPNYREEVALSPNTKMKNVKQKYLPCEMEEINEESVESDLTSSILSKTFL